MAAWGKLFVLRTAVPLLVASLLLPLAPMPAAAGGPGLVHTDAFPSAFQATFELVPLPPGTAGFTGGVVPLVVAGYGPTTVLRSDPYVDPLTGGWVIDTEIVDMQLSGTHPLLGDVLITESPTRASTGRIVDVVLGPTGDFLQGDSHFDVFFEVRPKSIPGILGDVVGSTFFNVDPFRVVSRIDRLPPFGNAYYHPQAAVPIWGVVAGGLRTVAYSTAGCHHVLGGGPSHAICLTASGRTDPTGCIVGSAFLRASDASSPAHTLVGVTTTAVAPAGTLVTPWTDVDADSLFEALAVTTSPACVTVTLTATGTLSHGPTPPPHTATATISWRQRL